MTRLLLIRHGQSANNAQPEHLRICDPGLTMVGVNQAAATARFLESVAITHLYCSPFLRALETARPIAESKQLTVYVHPEIFEQGGCYSGHEGVGRRGEPGMGYSQLREKYPGWHIDPSISESGWWGKDYESFEAARVRAGLVCQWLTRDVSPLGGTHALVIHADFKALLVSALQAGSRLSSITGGALHNTGITELAWTPAGWKLVSLNSVSHLPDPLVTL